MFTAAVVNSSSIVAFPPIRDVTLGAVGVEIGAGTGVEGLTAIVGTDQRL